MSPQPTGADAGRRNPKERPMAEKVQSVFNREVSKGRLEFLFDGIFAISMTILVLELKLPEQLHDRRSLHELGVALLHNWRTFLSYVMSFFVLSGFWIGHNQIYVNLKRISKAAMAIHVWLMAWAAFIPFCAHLIGRYPSNPLTLAIYFTAAFAYTLGLMALVLVAERQKLFDPAVPAADVRKLRRGFVRSLIIFIFVAVYFVFIMPRIG
jgi:uncharacterized membrane protein